MEKYIDESEKHGFLLIIHALPNASYEEYSFQWYINENNSYVPIENEIYESMTESQSSIKERGYLNKSIICKCTNKLTSKDILTDPVVLTSSFSRMLEVNTPFDMVNGNS